MTIEFGEVERSDHGFAICYLEGYYKDAWLVKQVGNREWVFQADRPIEFEADELREITDKLDELNEVERNANNP